MLATAARACRCATRGPEWMQNLDSGVTMHTCKTLLQEQADTVAQAAALTAQYQAQLGALCDRYEARHAEGSAVLSEACPLTSVCPSVS